MIAAGDIVVVDLGGETREIALVVSNVRFHRASGRALIAPEFRAPTTIQQMPWHVAVDGRIFAADSLQSIWIERALDVIGHADARQLNRLRAALMHMV